MAIIRKIEELPKELPPPVVDIERYYKLRQERAKQRAQEQAITSAQAIRAETISKLLERIAEKKARVEELQKKRGKVTDSERRTKYSIRIREEREIIEGLREGISSLQKIASNSLDYYKYEDIMKYAKSKGKEYKLKKEWRMEQEKKLVTVAVPFIPTAGPRVVTTEKVIERVTPKLFKPAKLIVKPAELIPPAIVKPIVAIAKIIEPVKTALEKAQEKVMAAYQKVYYFYKPEEKIAEERIREVHDNYETGVKKFNEESKALEGDISKFEGKYIGRELPEKEYNIAVKEQGRLKEVVRKLEESEKFWTDFREKATEFETRERIKAKAFSPVRKVLTSFSLGVITAPLAITGMAITAITKPTELIKGVFIETPRAIIERPLEVIPEIIGGAVVFTGVVGIMRSAISKVAAMKVTPKVTQSFSVTESIRVGRTPEGLGLWGTKGNVITKLVNPRTGKTISVLRTETVSSTITAPSKAGSIKAFTESWAATVRAGDVGIILGKVPRIKLNLAKSKGTMTLSPTEVERLWRGFGEYGIREIGKAEILLKPKPALKIKLKPGREFEALSDVWMREMGVAPKIIAKITPKKIVAIKGAEYRYMVRALTDIYGKEGAEAIIRAKELGVAKAFIPRKYYIGIRKLPKPSIIKAKLPPELITKPVEMGQRLQQLIGGIPEKAVAKAQAAQISKITARAMLGEVKPIKVVTTAPPALKLAPAVVAALGVSTTTKLREREIEKYRQKVSQLTKLEQIAKQRERLTAAQITAQIEALTERQIAAQKVAQVQAQKYAQRQIQALQYVIPTVAIPIPYVPPVIPISPPPVILFPFKPTPEGIRARKKREAQLKKQYKAYTASVGEALLGRKPRKLTRKQREKIIKARYTGIELRPRI